MQQFTDSAYSYIELMAAIACLSILTAAAIPAWQQNQSGNRLIQASEAMAQDLRSVRSLSLSHNTPYYIHFDNSMTHAGSGADEDWCYIPAAQADCHCLDAAPAAPNCAPIPMSGIHRVSARDHPGIHLIEARFGSQHYTRFDPVRGTARFGRLQLEDDFHRRLQINISLLGRIRICRPGGTPFIGAYPAC